MRALKGRAFPHCAAAKPRSLPFVLCQKFERNPRGHLRRRFFAVGTVTSAFEQSHFCVRQLPTRRSDFPGFGTRVEGAMKEKRWRHNLTEPSVVDIFATRIVEGYPFPRLSVTHY